MKAILRWSLRQRRAYTLWWCLGVSLFIALEISFFPALKDQAAQLNHSFDQIPDTVKSLIGDTGNYFSPENYLNSRVFYLVVPILFAILMINLGSALLAREERDHTLELLLARPISRGRLLLGKALSGLVISGTIAFVGLAVCIGLSQAVSLPNSAAQIAAAMLVSYLLCLVFGAFAFMLTAVLNARRGLALSLSTLLFITSYVLTGLVGAAHWLEGPVKLLPYYYFEPQKMLAGSFTWPAVLGYSIAILVFGIIAWAGFRRRDID